MTGRSRLRCRPTFLSGVAIAMASVVTLPATVAHAQDDAQLETSIVLNDSPTYAFSDGAAPTRNAPTAVVQLTGKLSDDGVEVDVTQLARFLAEDEPVSARVAFYGGRDFMVAGGVRFELTPANGPVDAEVIEREEVGTDTSPEVWDPAPDFGTATATTAGGVISIDLVAKGRYRRLLRDPRTAVGLDLLPGTDGTQIQPSVRVSVGDLTGGRPGLVTPQGTAVGSDDSPKPWITTPVAKDVRV